jgi:hypothetical protein
VTLDVSGRPVELRALDLDRFFTPRSVLILGASDSAGKPTAAMTRKLRAWAAAKGADVGNTTDRRLTGAGESRRGILIDHAASASSAADATTAAGATEIRLSNRRDGGLAKPTTPGAEPVWLRNGQEFLYDLDPSHAAVFSLPTMSFILLADPGLGGHQMIAEKAVSPNTDALALLLVDDKAQWATAVYEGRGFEHRGTFGVPRGHYLQFDPRSQHLLLPFNQSASISTLTSLDWRRGQLRHVGHYPGLEIADVRMVARTAIVLARRRVKDAWLIAGSQRTRLTKEGQIFAATMSGAGELLLSKQAADGTLSIWLQRPDGSVERVTSGPDDVRPNFSPDGQQWTYVDYSRKSVMLCANTHGGCKVLRYDEMLPTWPTFSPDGRKIAYITQMGTPRLLTVSLEDGKTEQIGPMHTQCPPIWSSPTSIWSLEGAGKEHRWVERDVESAAATGRAIHLDENHVARAANTHTTRGKA